MTNKTYADALKQIADRDKRLAENQIKKDLEEEIELEKCREITLQDVYNTVKQYLYINDTNRIDLILATALSNQLDGTPIWMFIVGSSGDWKSAFTRGLEGLPNVIKVDQLTKNTLATGMKDAWDLGKDLQNKSSILLFPDLASLTSMNGDEKNIIWAQFRNLYDGFILKSTGGGVKKQYENCHVTLIACTTPAIRDEILVHAQLGTRELLYDTEADAVDDDLKMDMAWENEQYEEQMQQDIKNIVHMFIKGHEIKDIEITDDLKQFFKKEAKRLKILRASGAIDRRNRELINPLSPEVPTRVIKQFKRIYIALKSLDKDYPDEKCKEIISRIVDSSGNKVRQQIMDFLRKNPDRRYKIIEVHKNTRIGRSACKSQLEMLWNLDVISKDIVEERIGGYVTNYDGYETTRGGKIEEISYYQYRREAVFTQSTTTHVHTHYGSKCVNTASVPNELIAFFCNKCESQWIGYDIGFNAANCRCPSCGSANTWNFFIKLKEEKE